MNGSMLRRWFYHFLDAAPDQTDYAPLSKVYDCLDAAAGIFVRETRVLHDIATINTDAGRQHYPLPPDFLDLYVRNSRGRYCIRYEDGACLKTLYCVSYDEIFMEAVTEAQSYPETFAISEKGPSDIPPALTGAATATAAPEGGQSSLADDGQDFAAQGVSPRDIVMNVTSGAMGIVLAVADATHLTTALFDASGAPAGWTSGDAYSIQSATKASLIVSAPSAVSGHVITVPYICMPRPIYADAGVWPLSSRSCQAIAAGAASLFKLPKTEYVEAQALGGLFNEEIRRYQIEAGARNLKSNTGRHRERLL